MSGFVIVRIAERPDLIPVVAEWLHDAFGRPDGTMEEARRYVEAFSAAGAAEQCFVLLADGAPVGTASLVAHDLEERPDLTPWLASVAVPPAFRGRGHASRLVRAVEASARQAGVVCLYLFTVTAVPLYAGLGWSEFAVELHRGKAVTVMTRDLAMS